MRLIFGVQITQLQAKDVDEDERTIMFDRTHARTAARAYQSIVQLRGMWVKTGQYLSSRADIMPEVRRSCNGAWLLCWMPYARCSPTFT